jgi:hypothetical protein
LRAGAIVHAVDTGGLFEHDLVRKPVPIPDLVEDKLFGIMLRSRFDLAQTAERDWLAMTLQWGL